MSVLVPARNEARSLATCLESLAAQNYAGFEIIVLDDQSSDGTGALLDEFAARYSNVTALHGHETPPPGWNGKSHACHRLAATARGEWLLFTDADTIHAPDSLKDGIAQAQALDVDFLSAFPRQITPGWSEKILVSFILDFLPLVGLDLNALWRGKAGLAAANGQYVLVNATAYRVLGGHKAIARALVDDVAIVRHFRASGHRVALVDGTSMLSCRMYRSAREVWHGFAKNILLGVETSLSQKSPWWAALIFAWGYASVFVLPFTLLFSTPSRRRSLVLIGWLGLLRAAVNQRLRRSLVEVATTPLAAWMVMALGVQALVRRYRSQPVRWKDRGYSLAG